jgi:hypothetical protein
MKTKVVTYMCFLANSAMRNRVFNTAILMVFLLGHAYEPLRLVAGISAPVNVVDFGVKGDGVADDTAGLQAAIASACSGPLNLHIPAGKFLISGTLSLCTGLHLWGDSSQSSLFIKTRPGPAFLINGTKYIVIEHINISGGTGGDASSHGISMTVGAFSVFIRDIYVSGMAGNGIDLNHTIHVSISESKLTGNMGDGLSSQIGSTLTVEHCYLNENLGNGMTVNTQNARYIADVFESNSGYGAVLGGSGIFEGNYFEANTLKALSVGGDDYLIAGNLIFGDMELARGAYNITVESNHFGTPSPGSYNILISSGTREILVALNLGTIFQEPGARNVTVGGPGGSRSPLSPPPGKK